MTISPDKIADLRVKQLEMIQAIVTRISSNEVNVKNFCLTITTAICGFAITLQKPVVIASALVPITIFVLLDAQLLRVERRFRCLFDILRSEAWDSMPQFAIDIQGAPIVKLREALTSWSILAFYPPLVLAVLAVFALSTMISKTS